MGNERQESAELFAEKLKEAKVTFGRAVECKHTDFDDLYPYMAEHPQFFWYKRYVAWSALLTVIEICESMSIDWKVHFSEKQAAHIQNRVMSSKVLDEWFEKEHVGG